MSIPLQKEKAYPWEGLRIFERCIFCDEPTRHWHTPTNSPICENCGDRKNVEDIKKNKDEN